MDDNTTYRLSYWEGPTSSVDPFRPEDSLTIADSPMADETTHKLSFLGNWCIPPETSITPCEKQWLGRGPMQDVTTQKHDYIWKHGERTEAYNARQNLYCPASTMSDDTTYRLSYYGSACNIPMKSYSPIRRYVKSDVPMDGCTTYRLSYWPNEMPAKEECPWTKQNEYHPPIQPMDVCTTYKLSYWPNCQEPRKPFSLQESNNILNANCCFDDNTTYKLSYYGCGSDKRETIRQTENVIFSSCPLSYDTTHRLSYVGNWCVKPENSITPCEKQWLGSGPMQEITTQKHDYTWKRINPERGFKLQENLTLSSRPLECKFLTRVRNSNFNNMRNVHKVFISFFWGKLTSDIFYINNEYFTII
ncbi:uncharacterized protein LOC107271646 isoform X2 [Cephus cinctus]|nr:uncharacterized protein LOC107271646 isoform X2 [Cephus cinctus]